MNKNKTGLQRISINYCAVKVLNSIMVGLKYLFIFYMQNRPQNQIQTLVNSAEINAVAIRGNYFQSLSSNYISSRSWYEPMIRQSLDKENASFFT